MSCPRFRTAPSSDFSPDLGRHFASSAYRHPLARRSLHVEHPMRSPGVTPCSSAPCRSHTPWYEGWMDGAFVAIVPTRPCPLFGRPVHRRDGSHRLRPGASPHALRIPPHGGHPALPGLSRQGQRGVTLAFGYGALHPSASGTSTHLSMSLPSAHYGPVRLPQTVHRRRVSLDFPTRPVGPSPAGSPRLSRFSREVCPSMLGVSDRAELRRVLRGRRVGCGLPLLLTASALRSKVLSRLNTRPARPPCQRFATALADDCA